MFAELLERVKTTPARRKEQAKREEQLYQLRVARKKQIAIDKVSEWRRNVGLVFTCSSTQYP